MNTSTKRLGGALRTLREQSSYSLGEIAGEMGVTQKAWAAVERDAADLTVYGLWKFASIVGVSPASIFEQAGG